MTQKTDTFTELSPREELTVKLNGETAIVAWQEIEKFFAAGQVLLVKRGADLISCGVDIALDDKEKVQALISAKQLQPMPIEFVKEHCKPETELWSLVVRPYILAQLKD